MSVVACLSGGEEIRMKTEKKQSRRTLFTKEMDLETTQTNAAAKLPLLKQGPVTTEEKAQNKNDVKERSMLLMALPNEHQLTFNQYKDAKTLFAAIQTRFGGNDATKKTQKTLLKQSYENFNALSIESLDSIFNMLHKIISQNKLNLETMSFDDLYNNFKIVELEVKRTEQIHKDGLEEMDLKWQLALLSMRARKFYQRTGKKITINGSDTARYDKSKVECFQCHKDGDLLKGMQDTSSKAMVAIDGAGFDWSFMEEEEVTTNMALMAFSDSEVYNDKTCSNTYLKRFEALKTQLDNLRVEFNKSEFNLATYKRGLASVEEQLVFYKKNKAYLHPPTIDLSNSGLEEFQQPEFKGYGPKASKSVCVNTSNEVKKTSDTPLVEEACVSEKRKPKAVNTARPNFVAVKIVRANQANTVKASACWVWRPTKLDSALITLKKHNYIDARGRSNGCSRHMTGNISYLSDFQEFDGGYVSFGGGVRGEKNHCVDMKNIVPKESLTCLVVKATLDESMLWHRRLGHVNFKTINKLVKDNLVRGFPSKRFENDQTCVACLKGKQHKASSDSLGFFLSSKDETSGILKNFITEIENLADKKVKIIRCDNGREFKNRVMNEFCERKGIKREYSIARTPQQNGVAERRNRTLIKAARTMLADSKLPITFWAEAVNTTCYAKNRVRIVKPYNKTPYELFRGRTPALSFMRPFRCHVSILNTLDFLGKFDGKSDDGFFVGYSLTSKAFRVYNIRTRKVEENLHIRFLEDKPIGSGNGPKWLFDIDSLTKLMNYVPDITGTNSNDFAGSEVSIGEGATSKETDTSQDYIVMPLWKDSSLFDSLLMNVSHDESEPSCDAEKKDDEGVSKASGVDDQDRPESSTPNINTAGTSINTASINLKNDCLHINIVSPTVLTTSSNLPQTVSDIFSLRDSVTPKAINVDLFGDETKMHMNNLNASYQVPTTLNTRIHKDHSLDHVIGDIQSGVKTKGMTKTANEQGLLSIAYERKPHEDLNTYERGIVIRIKARLVAQGYTQEEGIDYDKVFAPVARIEAIRLFLAYASFMGSMVYQMDVKSAFLYGQIEEEVYVYQPPGFEDPDYLDKVYKVVKALYGLHQAPRAWYETLAKCLLDNGFHRGMIDQTLFIKKQKGDIFLVQVYVDDIIFGSTKKELCLEFEKLMHDKFQMSSMGELTFFLGLQVKQKEDGIFISQDKYVTDILKKFGFQDVRTASTPMDTEKPLLKDSDGDDVDVHLYRSMIGSLMYLTSSRPDIMFAVCACARFQVTPKVSHSHAVKRIFRYLKGKPKLGLWYPRDSPFDLVAYSDSDYAGASLDRKSTTGGCQFLGCRLISWQCKKQTVVATSSTEAEYVAAASCCGQDKQIEFLKLNASPLKHVKRGRDTKIPQSSGPPVKVGDEAVHKELGDKMERAATTASSLEAEQDSATARTTDDGEVEITANIDGQVKTITEASLVSDEAAFTSVGVDVGRAATTDIGLEAGQGYGTMHRVEFLEMTSANKEGLCTALTKLILRVKKLEKKFKTNKARRRARIVILEDKDAEEDSSKQGRKISEIDKDPTISLVQPEQDMAYDFDVKTAEGFTTASVPVTIASATPEKKTKKQLEQERFGHEEAIRLQEQINEEERQRIARDAEIAKQLQEEFDRARQE
ncbi:putative ribonuclease H-like domain-containing protein [Tanacetum coccineum]